MATQTRVPNGMNGTTNFIPLGGGDPWLEIDDTPGAPDDDSSYLETPVGTNCTFMAAMAAFDINSSAVARVSIYVRAKRTSGTNNHTVRLRDGTGADHTGPTTANQLAYTTHQVDWLTNPVTGVAWTEAQVEGTDPTTANNIIRFGVFTSGVGGSDVMRITQHYIEVEYTDAGGGGGTNLPLLVHHYKQMGFM